MDCVFIEEQRAALSQTQHATYLTEKWMNLSHSRCVWHRDASQLKSGITEIYYFSSLLIESHFEFSNLCLVFFVIKCTGF